MTKKIFRSSFLVAVVVLLASFALELGFLYDKFENNLQSELKTEAGILIHAVENQGIEFLENLENEEKRITLIASDGRVLFDNLADVNKMDNHSGREEIRQAFEYGSGKSIRYSETLTEKTIYHAIRLADGSVLRLSTTQQTVLQVIIELVQPMLIVFVSALILSLFLSSRVSKSIIRPLNAIDLDRPESNNAYEELSPLLQKISAQKTTIENQLRKARQKQEEFNLITDNMSEGFLVIDTDTNLLTYNNSALRLFGIDEAVSGSVLSLNRTKNFRELIKKVLGGARQESAMEFDNKNYNLIATPVSEEGKIIGAVIIIIDVTETSERESLRREFTANVSHELKTPLTSISGFAELMKEGGMNDENVRDFATSIYVEAQRMITLVSDIIKLSELDEKSEASDTEDVNLYELSENIVSRLKFNADKNNIIISVSGKPLKVMGVHKILDEMIYNLCDNAIKYNKPDGKVDIIISETPRHVKLAVKDTGIGIPKSHHDRVFERFYRVDKSHSKTIGGTGLGLSIVKHGAMFHDAAITLASVEGKGTTIILSFKKIEK